MHITETTDNKTSGFISTKYVQVDGPAFLKGKYFGFVQGLGQIVDVEYDEYIIGYVCQEKGSFG